jgi:adenosine deaminase
MNSLADLHRHLDGSMRPETLAELAQRIGKQVPADLPFAPGMGLAKALAKFELTLACLQEPADVRRVASEICEDAEAEGVGTLEIRFAPQLHKGAELEAIIDAALDGINGRAGLILCCLYGEPPMLLDRLVGCAAARQGAVGIDLAGSPEGSALTLADYAESFQRAGDLGLGRTVHAGEGRPAQEIRDAIELLGAERIGHGTTLLDSPEITELVVKRGTVIEACITSNLHTGVIKSRGAHPIAGWLKAGVKVAICTDNTLLSSTNAQEEFEHASRLLDPASLLGCIDTGHEAAFRRT